MKKRGLIAVILAAIMLCGCAGTEKKGGGNQSSIIIVPDTSEESFESLSTESAESTESSFESSTESSTESSSSEPDPDENFYAEFTFIAPEWDPVEEDLGYDFPTGSVIKGLEERYLVTGEQMGYEGEWCCAILSLLLYEAGYDFEFAYNPCDLAINLLDAGLAEFYCLREENYDSLVYWGLQNTDKVKMVSSDDFIPKRGDFICYLWDEERDEYNWSHIGMVAKDYDGGGRIYTIEGNIGRGYDPVYHRVEGRKRPFDQTVIGFIRVTV